MKNPGTLLVSWLLLAASAQAQQFDTSILKNGNTWIYQSTSSSSGSGGIYSYSGIKKCTLDSLVILGDTLKFNIIQEDSGTGNIPGTGHTIQVDKYVFSNNSFSAIPVFAEGQTFSEADAQVLYRNDTVRYRSASSSGATCSSSSTENLQGVGRTLSTYSYVCGNSRTSSSLRLLEFNGRPYESGDITILSPAALDRVVKRKPAQAAIVRLTQYRVLYVGEKGLYDTRGSRVPAPH